MTIESSLGGGSTYLMNLAVIVPFELVSSRIERLMLCDDTANQRLLDSCCILVFWRWNSPIPGLNKIADAFLISDMMVYASVNNWCWNARRAFDSHTTPAPLLLLSSPSPLFHSLMPRSFPVYLSFTLSHSLSLLLTGRSWKRKDPLNPHPHPLLRGDMSPWAKWIISQHSTALSLHALYSIGGERGTLAQLWLTSFHLFLMNN